MALLDFRSFGERSASTEQPPGWSMSTGAGTVVGRFTGTRALSVTGGGFLTYAVPGAPTTLIIGTAFMFADTSAQNFIRFNGSTHYLGRTARDINNAYALTFTLNNVLVATSTAKFEQNIWRYAEVKIVAGVGGSIEVKVDGVIVLSYAFGAGTVGTDFTSLSWNFSANAFGAITDIYICNSTAGPVVGHPQNDYLGDQRADYLVPNGDGSSSQLVGSDGNSVNNYLLVDEVPPSATDYVSSATPGQKDLYALTNPPSTVDKVVEGAKVIATVFKNDAGTAKMRALLKDGAATYVSGTQALSTTPTTIGTEPIVQAISGALFTSAEVNALEAGVEVIA